MWTIERSCVASEIEVSRLVFTFQPLQNLKKVIARVMFWIEN